MKQRRRVVGLSLVALLVCAATTAAAQSNEAEADRFSIDVHGFASQGFILTTGNEYLVSGSKSGSFEVAEVGINFSKSLTDKLRFGLQLFAQNFGGAGNYTPQVDWFYLDYAWTDWLGFRAGRLKIPLGLYNDVNDIDSARVPVLLPQSVYPLQARSFLFAQSGGELYGFTRFARAGALEYRLFGGTIFIDPRLLVPVGAGLELKFKVPYAFGGRLLWETPLPGLRVGGSFLKLRLETVAYLPMGMTATIDNDTLMGVGSVEYALRALTVTAEYSRGHSKQVSALPGSNIDVVGESMYVMVTYGATPWLQPGVYYALKYPDVDDRSGPTKKQHDVSLTLRFDINYHWLVKLEGHYMEGTAGLVNPLRIGPPPETAARRWGVFLVKTTVFF